VLVKVSVVDLVCCFSAFDYFKLSILISLDYDSLSDSLFSLLELLLSLLRSS